MLRIATLALVLTTVLPAQVVQSVPLKNATDRATYRHILNRVRRATLTVSWDETELQQVMKELGRRLEINFVFSRTVQDRREDRVKMTLNEVPAASVLRLLEDALKITFQHRHGVVYLTTPEDAVKNALTLQIHGVAMLLYSPPDFPAPRQLGLRPSGTGGGLDTPEEPEEREEKDPAFLIDLIRSTTGEANWEIEGTSIAMMGKSLVVRHTPEMQRRVTRLLSSLRGVY